VLCGKSKDEGTGEYMTEVRISSPGAPGGSTLAGAVIWRVARAKMAVRWLFHPIYNMAEFVNLSKLNVDGALA
jgi:hypothetical protein